jgi:hypothetical protein
MSVGVMKDYKLKQRNLRASHTQGVVHHRTGFTNKHFGVPAAELPRPELTAVYQVIQLNHRKSDRKSEMFYVHPFKNIFF